MFAAPPPQGPPPPGLGPEALWTPTLGSSQPTLLFCSIFFFFTFYFLDFTCKWSNFSDFFLSKRKSPGEFKRKTSLFMFLWDLLLSLWIFSKEWNNFCFQKVYINQLKPWQCEQLLSSPCQYPHHSCLQPRVTVNCEQSKIIPSCKNLKTWKKWTY